MLNSKSFFNSLTSASLSDGHKNSYNRYVVSFSGGLDSMVLLHLIKSVEADLHAQEIKTAAIYVNHNLSPFSSQWGEFCKQVCLDYQIPFQLLSVDAQPAQGQSPEEAARNARYNALKKQLSSSDCLLTAHHQNDQAETLMLNLLRGSGSKGLAAMSAKRNFFHLTLVRPLLTFSRDEIKQYALEHELQWVEDESNQNQDYKRNFLRHSILPKLQQKWPGIDSTLFRVSQLQSESSEILEEIAKQDLSTCEVDLKSENNTIFWLSEPMLDRQKLLGLSKARIKNCIQYWLRKHNTTVLNSNLLEQFLQNFIFSQPGSKTSIDWKKQQQKNYLRYYQGRIFLSHEPVVKAKVTDKQYAFLWNYKNNKLINLDNVKIQAIFSQSGVTKQLHQEQKQLAVSKLPKEVRIAFRQGGEIFKKNQHSQHFSLKKWFQEQSVPPWLRSKIPLFYADDELIQVGNILVNQYYKLEKTEPATCFNFCFDKKTRTD